MFSSPDCPKRNGAGDRWGCWTSDRVQNFFTAFSFQACWKMTEYGEMRLDKSLTNSDAGFSAEAVNRDADFEHDFCLVRSIMKCLRNGTFSELNLFLFFFFLPHFVTVTIAIHLSVL